ncbi:MAG: epoxyqueuosine reductase QueH [Thermodesulfobacteriota bacterium]
MPKVPRGGPITRVLVHMCCGPCSIYPIKELLGPGADVWGFFHNPNIHPLDEFKKRLDAVKRLAAAMDLDVIYDEAYRPMEFIRGVRGLTGPGYPAEGVRCEYCYTSRLEATAAAAASGGFDAFTTSLLYSRYQDHEGIKRFGLALADAFKVEFLYRDFRPGWQEGIVRSREMGLYRQKYCGCVYSRLERYSKKFRKVNRELKRRLEDDGEAGDGG